MRVVERLRLPARVVRRVRPPTPRSASGAPGHTLRSSRRPPSARAGSRAPGSRRSRGRSRRPPRRARAPGARWRSRSPRKPHREEERDARRARRGARRAYGLKPVPYHDRERHRGEREEHQRRERRASADPPARTVERLGSPVVGTQPCRESSSNGSKPRVSEAFDSGLRAAERPQPDVAREEEPEDGAERDERDRPTTR